MLLNAALIDIASELDDMEAWIVEVDATGVAGWA